MKESIKYIVKCYDFTNNIIYLNISDIDFIKTYIE